MTLAVCLHCGAFKHGAFSPCPSCRYTPDDDESLTRHLLVTDHYHSREELEAIANRIKAGEPITFDPDTLKAAWVSKAQLDAQMRQLNRGCLAVLAAIIALAVIGVVVYVLWT